MYAERLRFYFWHFILKGPKTNAPMIELKALPQGCAAIFKPHPFPEMMCICIYIYDEYLLKVESRSLDFLVQAPARP
jgi:hypothetical protein